MSQNQSPGDPSIREEFVASEGKKFPFQLGKKIAASLPSFIVGLLAGIIILLPLLIWLFIEIYSLKRDLITCLGGF